MKIYRLERYDVGDEVRYFWVTEDNNGSTITLTPSEFSAMVTEQSNKIKKRYENSNARID
jgi:hypothetical protein